MRLDFACSIANASTLRNTRGPDNGESTRPRLIRLRVKTTPGRRRTGLRLSGSQRQDLSGHGRRQQEKCGLCDRSRSLKAAVDEVVYSVRSEDRRQSVVKKLLAGDSPVLVCDVEKQLDIDKLAIEMKHQNVTLDGVVHSIAFADYPEGSGRFTKRLVGQFLQAIDISAFSLTAVANALKDVSASRRFGGHDRNQHDADGK